MLQGFKKILQKVKLKVNTLKTVEASLGKISKKISERSSNVTRENAASKIQERKKKHINKPSRARAHSFIFMFGCLDSWFIFMTVTVQQFGLLRCCGEKYRVSFHDRETERGCFKNCVYWWYVCTSWIESTSMYACGMQQSSLAIACLRGGGLRELSSVRARTVV